MPGTKLMKSVRTGKHRLFHVGRWATDIRLEEGDSELVVTGRDPRQEPVANAEDKTIESDIVAGYDAERRRPRVARKAPHFAFAAANTPRQQIEFVREYGPILANRLVWDVSEEALLLTAIQDL